MGRGRGWGEGRRAGFGERAVGWAGFGERAVGWAGFGERAGGWAGLRGEGERVGGVGERGWGVRVRSGEWGGDAPVQLAPPWQVLRAEEVAVKISGGTEVSWLPGRLVLGTSGPPPAAPQGSCAVQGPQLATSCPGPAPRGRQGTATLPRAEGAAPGQTSAGPGVPAPPRARPQGAQLGLDAGILHRAGSPDTQPDFKTPRPMPARDPTREPRLWSRSRQGGSVPPA